MPKITALPIAPREVAPRVGAGRSPELAGLVLVPPPPAERAERPGRAGRRRLEKTKRASASRGLRERFLVLVKHFAKFRGL